jgi:hypothetical protein
MAQRATKFAKKTSRHVEVGALARASSPSEELRGVPLEILPLLAPFKKRGRLTVRIEKLPIQARLSAGRNNGDHSYSLMMDELEDLEYLAPDGTDPRPVLSVRIITLEDGDASTIAVRELPVEFGGEELGEIDLANISNEELRRLIEELTRVKSTLSMREAELNEARAKSAMPGKLPPGTIDAELIEARAAWKAEMDEKIAKVKAEAAANLEKSWAAWQAEQKQKSRNDSGIDIDKERARWQQESAAVLAEARREWKAEEERRLAAAEAKWRAEVEHAAEKQRASSKGVREHGDAIELRRLRDELLAMQNLLAERDAELAQAKTGKIQSPSRQEIEAAVAKAQKEWKEGEAARLAAVEARAQEKANRALADAQAQAKSGNDKIDAEIRRLRDELSSTQARLANREKELAQAHNHVKTGKAENDAELRRLRDETGALQSKLVNRDKELAQAQLAVKDALERGRKTADEILAKAETAWKARESDRMMTAEVQWQETSTKMLADARAQAKAELDAALSKARERWVAETDATLAKAEATWKAREADRLMTAEVQWKEKSSKSVSEARAQAQAARDESAVELVRLRTELANAQSKLAERDTAVAEARAKTDRVREEGKAALADAEKNWRASEATKIAVVEQRLRDQAGSALTESETARSEAETELRQLREHAAVLETTLADRELELTQAIARINATERQLEELHENEDIQVRRVKGEVTQLQAQLAEREEELAQSRLFAERSYERWQKQAEAELAKAQKMWKASETSKLAAARAEWQEESRKALEQSLAAERRAGRLPPPRPPEEAVSVDIAGNAEDRPMPEFEPPPQDAPYSAPKPLADARAAADQALDRLAMDAYQLLTNAASVDVVSPTDTRIIKGGFVERRQRAGDKDSSNKSLIVSGAIAAALAAAAVVAFFFIWPSNTQPAEPQQIAAPAKPIAPVAVVVPKATVLRSVNVRSGPSTSDAVITTLKAGSQVVAGERNGSWVRVSLDAAGGKPAQQGWAFASSLQLPVAAVSLPAPAAPSAATETQAAPEAAPEAKVEQNPAPEPASAAAEAAKAPTESAREPQPAPAAGVPPSTAPAAESQAAPTSEAGGQVIQSAPVGE